MDRANVEDIYRLSPVQQGMLFHTLYAPGEAVYFEQFNVPFAGTLDVVALARVWQEVVERNPVLRTAFAWEGLEEPVQIVHRRAAVPIEELDWRGLPAAEQDVRLAERAAAERRRGFDLTRPPLLRLVVVRLADDAWHVIWNYHHLILDGWSASLLNQEVGALFAAAQAEAGPLRARPRRPFRDYVAWLRRQDVAAVEPYWRRVLAGFTAPTPLGIDRPPGAGRPEARGGAAATAGRDMRVALLPEAFTEALKSWARARRLTVSTVVQGAWALLLGRYSGEEDVVYGLTVSGRPPALPGVETMLGCFINTLPVRVRLTPAAEVAPWLQALQAAEIELRRWEHSPLVQVMEWSQVPRPAPLFESIFVFEGFAGTGTSHHGVFQRTSYPLALVAGPDRELVLRADFERERFEAAAVERLLGHLASVLKAFVSGTERRLEEIEILTAPEREQLRAWNATRGEYADADTCLHELIARQVERTPEAVAVSCEGEELTYRELDAGARALARRLRALGVGPEVSVGICAERSLELVVGLLGILAAGGAYVPLDPSYPRERLAYMLDDARVPVVLTQRRLLERLGEDLGWVDELDRKKALGKRELRREEAPVTGPRGAGAGKGMQAAASGPHVLCFDREEPGDPSSYPEASSAPASDPSGLAYVIYTSGSTGKPKGTMNSHRGIVNRLLWMQERYGLTPADRVLQKTPFSFDVSVWEFFWPLLVGARLVMARPGGHQDPAYLVATIRDQGITTLHFVPSMLQVLLEAPGVEQGCAGLVRVICSGEALPREVVRRFFSRLPAAELHNLYGPTEAAVDVTHWRCEPDDTGAAVPIGRPVANTEIHLVDAGLRPVPVGVAGELLIGGVQVGRGYWQRPELTAERFVPDPFSPAPAARPIAPGGAPGARPVDPGGAPGARLYRTGDLARRLPDGAVEFLGRLDHQVKLRGFRIELGEVEAALAAHPRVAEAVVIARADAEEEAQVEKRLVAYVVPRWTRSGAGLPQAEIPPLPASLFPEPPPTAATPISAASLSPPDSSFLVEELRASLAARLPDYMVPSAFVVLDALPLSPNGKLDRKALPAPARVSTVGGYVAPWTPVEELVAGVWAEVLGVPRVGRNDRFFDLGGHSLLAMRAASRLHETVGIDVPVRALFDHPEVAELARHLEGLRAGDRPPAPPLVALPRSGPAGAMPLSFSQERLWFLDRLQPGTAVYNIPAALRLDGPLDVGALYHALHAVARRHEALRTTFGVRDGLPVQCVRPLPAAALPVVDLSALAAPARDAAARRLTGETARRPFDLAAGPLLRHLLLRLAHGDGSHRPESALVLVVHHIVADGWSLEILLREVSVLYAAFAQGRPSPLPELPLQYGDYARWQREWLRGEVLDQQLAYWRERLAGIPAVTPLPTDRPRPAVQRYRGGHRAMVLRAAVTAAAQALGRRRGATFFMVLLAALDALLTRSTGQEDLVVGTPIAGRNRVEIEGLIGFFLNTLVLRTDASGRPTFATLLARVRDATLAAFAHQDLPFEKLVEALAPERSLSHAPLFQIQLVLQNPLAAEPLAIPGLRLTPMGMDSGTAKFDLTLNATETPQGLLGVWLFNRDLFDAVTVQRLAGHLETLLAAAVADPGRRLSELPLLTAAEAAQLREWNATRREYPEAHVCLHELIARQVERTPEAVAVSFEGETLTYRELHARARALAHRLRALGIGPEVPVGICAERSLELVVGLLGVLEAGGAYMPLDPSYPRERLAYMLHDARVPVVLTQQRLLARLGEDLGWLEGERKEPGGEDAATAAASSRSSRVLCLDRKEHGEEAPSSHPEALPPPAPDPSSLAYVIYTSGSTGKPKGAMNSHRGIVNRLLWMQEQYGLTPADRVLQKTPFSFDVSVWEFFWPLLAGARLVIARPGGHQDPAYLVEEIARRCITTLHFVPSMLQVFLGAPHVERCVSLQRVICSGEGLPAELERRFHERFDIPLYNLYGPTEAAVDVSWWRCERDGTHPSVPIGRPVANTELHVLDRDLRPAPIGVPGELCIGGVQVGRGYHRRPELTAERFVPDSLAATPGMRLYRTGDLARHLPEGAIEFLGRLDHQVKIRGFRIELGEIEAELAAHPAVREAVVVARGDGEERDQVGMRLVAYVVLRLGLPEPLSLVAELGAWLAARLPEYMVPSAFVVLDALPLSPNGKVDRRALPAPVLDARRPAGERVAPRDPVERMLAGLWGEVLGTEARERLGVNDSFFDLGGNSISGAIFVNRLQEALDEIVHVVTLFDAPTIAQLATYVEREHPAAAARLRGEAAATAAVEGPPLPSRRVTEAQLARLRSLLRADDHGDEEEPATRHSPAVFLLSPPRSGSTLLRVMLAGNPGVFAPPELELLGFRTLAERRDAFPGRDAFRLEGTLRAVMELRGCDAGGARALVDGFTAAGWTVAHFYRWVQEALGGRLLVDKTPTYAWDLSTLRRAERLFEAPLYVHLVRHPLGAIRSFEEARLEQIFFGAGLPFSRRELAELSWLLAHRNVLEFFREIPEERRHTVRFEELLRDPTAALTALCAFLGVAYHPDMARPYEFAPRRMTDGLHAASRMLGDVKFHQHRAVDPLVAERWRDAGDWHPLGDATLDTAAALGIVPDPAPLSLAQERLWFVEQLEPGTAIYNVTSGVRLRGGLDLPAFAAAVDAVVRRHGALRTTFEVVAGLPAQVARPDVAVPLPLADLGALSAAAREGEARRLATAAARAPFDLGRGPLVRALVLRLAGDEHAAHFTAHHIVCDGWSIGILIRDVAAVYRTRKRLPELPLQYADYARWQRRWLEARPLDTQLAVWRRRLAGVPPLELPTDRPRPPVQSFRGAAYPFALPAALSGALREIGAARRATLFMTVLAAFEGLLCRLSGQDDFAVGSPVAGRDRREIEPLIGFFVNTLVFRADLGSPGSDQPAQEEPAEPDFLTLLDRVRAVAVEAYAHQEVPFERVVQELAPERDLSRSPLFQVMLAFQNAARESVELPGLELAAFNEEFTTSKFDLSLTLFEGPQLAGQWVYTTALFDRATIARWAGHFRVLCEGLAADPARPIAELPLLTADETEQLLVGWNRPAVEYPSGGFVHRYFAEQARRCPQAAALVLDGATMSYGALAAWANGIAARLRRLGIGPDVVVGIHAERSFAMVAGLLGILQAGAAYLPLDPALPEERLRFMLEDAGAPLVLAEARLAASLLAGRRPLLLEDTVPAPAAPEVRAEDLLPDHPAYVIYTSGSTGRPKGVVVSHRALANRLQYARTGDLTAADAFLQRTTISFDVSLLEIFAPLAVGGKVVLVRPGAQQDLAYLVRTLREQGVTYASFPPSMLVALLEQEGFDRCTALRTVITGGEAVPRTLPGRFYDRLSGAELLNRYGPTETTISVTSWRCEREPPARGLPIGHPTAKARAFVVDRHLRPVPVGSSGELLVGGVCLARGYLRRPDLTAEKFVPDPFSGEAGSRLYRTGDVVRRRGDGALEFVGRIDQQVKIRGFRVEPEEVAAVLAAHADVAEAVVIARGAGEEMARADKRLVAYVVPRGRSAAASGGGVESLRSWLAARLPEHMVPSAFVVLDALPVTPTGKVDLRALPEPRRHGVGAALAPPRDPAEELLAAQWADLLGIEAIGIHDSFFAHGGHSLLAARALARLRETFGVDLPLRLLFERPTIAELAAEIAAVRRAGGQAVEAAGAPAPPPLVAVPRDGAPPLSFAQERLWFLDRWQPGRPTYNLPVALRLQGPLDVAAFRAALYAVAQRHESLRTTFVVQGDRPVQRIAPRPSLRLPVVDLAALPAAAREPAARRLAQEQVRRPFDLAVGPLLRGLLVRHDRGEHTAVMTMHHIVSDGWSVGVMIRETAALYGAALARRPSPLPPLPIQYADYAVWQRSWLRGAVLEAEVSHWRRRLSGAPPLLELPTDRPRPAVQRHRGRSLRQDLPPDLTARLLALCRAAGVTPFMALLTMFETLLHRSTGREDVVVGTPVAGRSHGAVEGLIGFFLNSLVLRTDLAGDPDVRELLRRVRETALDAYAHQDLPFEKLVEELAPERNLGHAPLFQTMLVFQNTPREAVEFHGVRFAPVDLETASAKLDLTVNARESGRGLVLVWLYNRDLFDAATIRGLAGHLETLLAAAVADPGRRLSELPLLKAAEAAQLREWNATRREYPDAEVCLHELIARQVERTPEAVAVSFEGEELTYRELDAGARALARRLRALGVGPEAPVGICAERSLELVVGLLGILEAGGAYVPLDPSYPRERLAHMLDDAQVAVVLTQQRLLARLAKELAAAHVRVLFLDCDEEGVAPGRDVLPPPALDPSSLAYVIYTSGSTGKPKGTMNSHRGIVNRLLWMQERYGLGPEDRVLQKTPFSFDVSVWEFFWPLLAGARLVMARPGGHQDPAYLVETIRDQGITTLHFVPSMLQVLLEAPGVEQGCAGLVRVICSGEALPREVVRRFFSRLPAVELHNLYGPTEAAVDVTHWRCERDDVRAAVPIGRPVANTAIHLVDPNLRPVPVGVAGELLIGGVQVGRGYWRRPDLTAERFVPDPFSAAPGARPVDPDGAPGARLYRTGDLARRLPEGEVEFLGRLDHQVKLRGFRIELGEIEAALAAHPRVAEAVVIARADGEETARVDQRLVAYVVPRRARSDAGLPEAGIASLPASSPAGQPPTAATPIPAAGLPLPGSSSLVEELRASLAARLPDYMLPAAFVVLDALPLSPNGKLDRRALAGIAPARPSAAAERVAPRTAVERFLAGLWSDALGGLPRDAFGVHDDFFALGGNSITGALLINRLQQALGEIVHVVAIFDSRTVARLADYLEAEYPDAVARRWGGAAGGPAPAGAPARPLDEARLMQVRLLVRTLAPEPGPPQARNPPALFVLSPPRSGSTLLRVMLAGNPRLFAPPELELLEFNTLRERREAFAGRDAFRLEGLLRAVMELHGCGPEEAGAFVARCENEGMTTRAFYRRLQERLGERLLVDKTPTYAWDPATLRRAEEAFAGARFLHLVRHPYGMIHSFEEARIDQIFFPEADGLGRRELAEALWILAHRNILDFFVTVPLERQHTLRFEELLADPETALRQVCAWLGVAYDSAMSAPYEAASARMTDGLHAASRMLGDVKFHQHRTVDPRVAGRWRERYRDDFLGDPTWRLAARLGYDPATERAAAAPLPSGLVQLRPGTSRHPLFLVHPLSGELLLYRHLVGALAPDQAVYGLQAPGFADGRQPLETIEGMADEYVAALLSFRRQGPFLLAGSSMGGLVAFEMARRLSARGHDVALTALLDAPAPGFLPLEPPGGSGDGEAELVVLRYATGGRTPVTLEELRRLSADERLELILRQGRESGGLGSIGSAELRRLLRVVEANRRALRAYRPEPADVHVTYVRAADGVRADAAWEPLALGGIDRHDVTGSHLSMHAPPHATALAELLGSRIAVALGKNGVAPSRPGRGPSAAVDAVNALEAGPPGRPAAGPGSHAAPAPR